MEAQKIKILRGVVTQFGSSELCVAGIGYYYIINKNGILKDLQMDMRLLGVERDNKFSPCYVIELDQNNVMFGYIISLKDEDTFLFQLIEGFDKRVFNSFEPDYTLGQNIEISRKDLMSIKLINFNLVQVSNFN